MGTNLRAPILFHAGLLLFSSVFVQHGEGVRRPTTGATHFQPNGILTQSEGHNSQKSTETGQESTCSPISWSDENCVVGPVSIRSDIAPPAFRQLCPRRQGKFEAPGSCDLYVVCHGESLTVNRCPSSYHFNPVEEACVDAQAYECSHTVIKDPTQILTSAKSSVREKRVLYDYRRKKRSLLSNDLIESSSSKALEPHLTNKRSPCKENYIEEHPKYCNKFIICSNGETTVQDCGPGTLFNPLSGVCDSSDVVDCASRMSDFGTYDCQKGEKYRAPHPEFCNKFLECEGERIHIKTCSFDTVFNPDTSTCDFKNKYKCRELISLEHDTDVNYLPSSQGRHGRDLSNYVCEFNYIAPLEGVCNMFVECEGGRIYKKSCGPGTAYNVLLGQCDWPHNVRAPDLQFCGRYLQCDGRKYVPRACSKGTFFNVGTSKCEVIELVSCAGKRDDPRTNRPPKPSNTDVTAS